MAAALFDLEHAGQPGVAGARAELSDVELVRRSQAGDRRAFDCLVRRHRARVLAVTLRYLRHTSDAEDAAQEALLAAYRGLGAFRGDCSFPTWLHRIAINAAKNALLARSRAANVVSLESLVSQSPDGAGAAAALRELETPETLSLSDDVSSAVDAALRALPRGHREAIVLREMDGLAYWQIAVALAIPMGTVRSRVFRAREFIDRQLRCVCDGGLGRGSRPLAPEIRRF